MLPEMNVSLHKEQLITFWKSSHTNPNLGIFLKDFLALQDGAFFYNSTHFCGKTDRIVMKICQTCICGQGSPADLTGFSLIEVCTL